MELINPQKDIADLLTTLLENTQLMQMLGELGGRPIVL